MKPIAAAVAGETWTRLELRVQALPFRARIGRDNHPQVRPVLADLVEEAAHQPGLPDPRSSRDDGRATTAAPDDLPLLMEGGELRLEPARGSPRGGGAWWNAGHQGRSIPDVDSEDHLARPHRDVMDVASEKQMSVL